MGDALRFHPLVADDLKSATRWYDDISVVLGNRFRDAVNCRLDDIERRPEGFALFAGNTRVARVQGFPYLLLLEHDGAATHVLGMFHAASDPSKWRQRFRYPGQQPSGE